MANASIEIGEPMGHTTPITVTFTEAVKDFGTKNIRVLSSPKHAGNGNQRISVRTEDIMPNGENTIFTVNINFPPEQSGGVRIYIVGLVILESDTSSTPTPQGIMANEVDIPYDTTTPVCLEFGDIEYRGDGTIAMKLNFNDGSKSLDVFSPSKSNFKISRVAGDYLTGMSHRIVGENSDYTLLIEPPSLTSGELKVEVNGRVLSRDTMTWRAIDVTKPAAMVEYNCVQTTLDTPIVDSTERTITIPVTLSESIIQLEASDINTTGDTQGLSEPRITGSGKNWNVIYEFPINTKGVIQTSLSTSSSTPTSDGGFKKFASNTVPATYNTVQAGLEPPEVDEGNKTITTKVKFGREVENFTEDSVNAVCNSRGRIRSVRSDGGSKTAFIITYEYPGIKKIDSIEITLSDTTEEVIADDEPATIISNTADTFFNVPDSYGAVDLSTPGQITIPVVFGGDAELETTDIQTTGDIAGITGLNVTGSGRNWNIVYQYDPNTAGTIKVSIGKTPIIVSYNSVEAILGTPSFNREKNELTVPVEFRENGEPAIVSWFDLTDINTTRNTSLITKVRIDTIADTRTTSNKHKRNIVYELSGAIPASNPMHINLSTAANTITVNGQTRTLQPKRADRQRLPIAYPDS